MFNFVKTDTLPEGEIKLPRTLWAFIWHFVRQAKWQFIAMAVFYILSTSCFTLTSYFVKLFVDTMTAIEAQKAAMDDLWPVLLGYTGVCIVLQSLLWRAADLIGFRTYPRFGNMVRRQLSLYLKGHNYSFFQNDFAGRLSGKTMETPVAINTIIRTFIHGFIYNFAAFIVSFALLAITGIEQLEIMLAVCIAYFFLMRWHLPRIKNLSKVAADQQSFVRGQHVDMITNILNVKLFSRLDYEDSRHLGFLKTNAEKFVKKHWGIYQFQAQLDIVYKIIWIAPALFALHSWSNGNISVGDVAMVLTLSVQLGSAMWNFSMSLATFYESLGDVQEGMDAVTKAHDGVDKDDAPRLIVPHGALDIRDITFRYGEKTVFDNFNLSIASGEKVGIVGPSGAGKSTLIQLLLRLYDVQGCNAPVLTSLF